MDICPACGAANRPGARFCSKCRTTLPGGVLSNPAGQPKPIKILQQGRYELTRELGAGGMGAVYLARDVQSNRPCAVKEMSDRFTDPQERAEAERSFQREVDILRGLYHVSIPEFVAAFTEANRHYLVMEYIEGHDLEHGLSQFDENGGVLRKGTPLSWSDAVKYAIQISDVLTYLHTHRPNPIIYRDLKPANVMLADTGRRLVLTDFGIARFFAPHTRGTAIGTPGYVPPEQYAGAVEARSDLYALAATMHHLLTDDDPRQPLRQRNPFTFPRVRSYNASVPFWLDEIIAANLRYDIVERYDSAQQLRDCLMAQTPRNTLCPKCGRQNPPGRAYCEEVTCGYPLSRATVACRQCGTANVINSKFCINCGAQI